MEHGLTPDQHKARHVELHKALDELVADWIAHQPLERKAMLHETSIMDLMKWSHQQTQNPEPLTTSN